MRRYGFLEELSFNQVLILTAHAGIPGLKKPILTLDIETMVV
jgi:hypothetical protein